MEKAVTTSYQVSADASFIYRDRTSANFAYQNSASVPGNLADVMRDSVTIFVPSLIFMERTVEPVQLGQQPNLQD